MLLSTPLRADERSGNERSRGLTHCCHRGDWRACFCFQGRCKLSRTPSSTRRFSRFDPIAFAFLYGQAIGIAFLLPDTPFRHLGDPVYQAAISIFVLVLWITALRLLHRKGPNLERISLALFLGAMPLVYVASWIRTRQDGWLGIELAGAAVFGAVAYLGLKRSPWILAIGILAHGALWDLWHYHHTVFMPDWYAVGCLVSDIGVGVYSAIQIPRWNAETNRESFA